MHPELENVRRRFIEAAGQTSQSFGMGRVIGQIFAHLYFNDGAQSLDDLTRELGISKGSASTVIRQLEQWGAVNRVWIKGDRKDYFRASEDFGIVVRKALLDNITRRMETADRFVVETEQALQQLSGIDGIPPEELAFLRRKTDRLRTFGGRAQYIWNRWIIRFFRQRGRPGKKP